MTATVLAVYRWRGINGKGVGMAGQTRMAPDEVPAFVENKFTRSRYRSLTVVSRGEVVGEITTYPPHGRRTRWAES